MGSTSFVTFIRRQILYFLVNVEESQPQNREFRNNPEYFTHAVRWLPKLEGWLGTFFIKHVSITMKSLSFTLLPENFPLFCRLLFLGLFLVSKTTFSKNYFRNTSNSTCLLKAEPFDISFWENLLTSRGLLSDSTWILKAKPSKLDIKIHEPGILFISSPIVEHFKLGIMA